jgi:hypothetical protein
MAALNLAAAAVHFKSKSNERFFCRKVFNLLLASRRIKGDFPGGAIQTKSPPPFSFIWAAPFFDLNSEWSVMPNLDEISDSSQ